MKAGIITGKRKFVFQDVAEPQMRATGAIVDILYCGICGSDVSAYKTGAEYPAGLCGHEWVGIVRDIDMEVAGVQVGTRVVCSTGGPCGIDCPECLQGHYSACTTAVLQMNAMDGFSPYSGGFAPRHLVNARRLLPVPDALSNDQAAMVEPATVALRAVRISGLQTGERVAVLGAGPVGLFAVQGLVAAGARDVVVIDPDPARQKLALALGAHHAWTPEPNNVEIAKELTGGTGFDRAFDCAGHTSTLEAAGLLTRQQGMVMLVGFSHSALSVHPETWVLKELQMRASLGYDKSDTLAVMGLMESDQLKTAEMHTGTVPLDKAGDLIEEFAAGSEHVKIIVDAQA